MGMLLVRVKPGVFKMDISQTMAQSKGDINQTQANKLHPCHSQFLHLLHHNLLAVLQPPHHLLKQEIAIKKIIEDNKTVVRQ